MPTDNIALNKSNISFVKVYHFSEFSFILRKSILAFWFRRFDVVFIELVTSEMERMKGLLNMNSY